MLSSAPAPALGDGAKTSSFRFGASGYGEREGIVTEIARAMTEGRWERRSLVDAGFRAMNWTHRAVLSASGGRYPKTLFGMPAVELHTIGRKSGQRRTTMLASPVHDENRVVLVASKGGDDRDPEWYLNLRANPDVEITMEGVTKKMRAWTASSDEKAALWPQILASYRWYESYQKRAGRDIPVVICEPHAD
jgi:deazaflavin-dependent oxidoreductase (nitroreductase family)